MVTGLGCTVPAAAASPCQPNWHCPVAHPDPAPAAAPAHFITPLLPLPLPLLLPLPLPLFLPLPLQARVSRLAVRWVTMRRMWTTATAMQQT